MRNIFEQKYEMDTIPISEVKIPITRDELPTILIALQHIFITPEINEEVFSLLKKAIPPKKRGRKGMDLWQVLVLAVVRNALDINYDRLHIEANYNKLIRKIMGVECEYGPGKTFGLQTIKDNVRLLDENIINQIDDLVIKAGHQISKKKKKKNSE